MLAAIDHPTPYPEVNVLLKELLESVQAILGNHFVAMYLDGSLASGDFDQDSDIDFVVVADREISGSLFSALQAMHDRIATMDSWYAIQLEGSYVSEHALRRYDPALAPHPNIERGRGERLKMVLRDDAWVTHQYVLREHGIALAGPAPQALIDPVSPTHLRQAMLSLLSGWVTEILREPAQIKDRGYQSYVVLSLCRVLYTLETGTVVSKSVAARWAQGTLSERWVPLIERTWAGRHNPALKVSVAEVNETLEFIHYSLERGRQFAALVES